MSIPSNTRLTRPLIRENGEHRAATWDEALDRVAEGFRARIAKYGPRTFGIRPPLVQGTGTQRHPLGGGPDSLTAAHPAGIGPGRDEPAAGERPRQRGQDVAGELALSLDCPEVFPGRGLDGDREQALHAPLPHFL